MVRRPRMRRGREPSTTERADRLGAAGRSFDAEAYGKDAACGSHVGRSGACATMREGRGRAVAVLCREAKEARHGRTGYRRRHRRSRSCRHLLRARPCRARIRGEHRHAGQGAGRGGSRVPQAGGRAVRRLRSVPHHHGVLGCGSVLGRQAVAFERGGRRPARPHRPRGRAGGHRRGGRRVPGVRRRRPRGGRRPAPGGGRHTPARHRGGSQARGLPAAPPGHGAGARAVRAPRAPPG